MSLKEIIQTVKLVGKIAKSSSPSNLIPKTKASHIHTKTTQNTQQISDSAQRQLSLINNEIITLLSQNISIKKIKLKLQEKVGSIISNTVRESYLLGFHFIESFENRTITLTAQHVSEINKEIDIQIKSFWNSVTKIIKDSKKKPSKTSSIVGAAKPTPEEAGQFLLLSLLKRLSIRLPLTASFLALNQGTITTQIQSHKENTKRNTKLKAKIKLEIPQLSWITRKDNRVCVICKKLVGKSWFVTDPTLPRPVKDSHIGCRCRLLPLKSGKVFNA